MNWKLPKCPTDEERDHILFGSCSEEDREQFETHLESCEECQTRIANLTATAEWQRLMPRDKRVQLEDTVCELPEFESPQSSDAITSRAT